MQTDPIAGATPTYPIVTHAYCKACGDPITRTNPHAESMMLASEGWQHDYPIDGRAWHPAEPSATEDQREAASWARSSMSRSITRSPFVRAALAHRLPAKIVR